MKSAAVAVALVLAPVGCGVQEWSFDVQGASTLDADASARIDSGPDALKRAYCLGDIDCAQPAYLCDPQSHKCVGCLTDLDCTQSAPHCDAPQGTCVVCIDDRDCTNPRLPHCAPFHGRCQECVASTDCPSGGPGTVPVCDVSQCLFSCADGGKCPASLLCNMLRPEARCAQCLQDSDCVGQAFGPKCDNGTCLEGMSSAGRPAADGGGVPDSGDAAADASSDALSDTSSRGNAMDGSD